MKLLVDNVLSPKIVERATDENRVIISADTDFGAIIALRQLSKAFPEK